MLTCRRRKRKPKRIANFDAATINEAFPGKFPYKISKLTKAMTIKAAKKIKFSLKNKKADVNNAKEVYDKYLSICIDLSLPTIAPKVSRFLFLSDSISFRSKYIWLNIASARTNKKAIKTKAVSETSVE
jgi:hypothetical protein